MPVVVDVETKSHADLPKVGAAVYAQHPSTEIICLCYGIDNEPIQEWWPGKKVERGIPWHGNMPVDLYMAIMSGHEIEAHNVSFEYSIWRWILAERHGWLMPYPHSWRDTMAAAAYYALPMKLDKLAAVLGFQGKDPAGDRLITKYSKLYLKTAKADIPPEDFRRFVDYCKKDVRIEQSVSDYLGDLPERETKIFLMDQAINRRGMLLDAHGIEAASEIVDKRAEELTMKFRQITGGLNPTQRDKVIAWCAEHGVVLENLQAEYLGELLESDELPGGPVRKALEIRLRISKASTKKLDAMARNRGSDGRARFQTRYHGTGTGRTSATGFQPLNMNRGFEYENKPGAFTPEDLIRDIHLRSPQWLDMLYGDATDAVGKATRHWVRAEEGSRIISGDFVSIEAVVLACLAGEDWKVEAFRSGAKLYELMADKIYGYAPGTVTKATHPTERQDGKTGELAFGFGGALGAWMRFDSSGRHSDEAIIEICKAWRAEHPAIVDSWYGLEEAALSAVNAPGQYFDYRGVGFEIVDEWLTMVLLNGKRLWYWKPELRTVMPRWHQPAVKEDCRNGTCRCRPKPQITYVAQKEGQWKRVSTYGGKLCLAGDTEVLTDRGWISIVNVQAEDLLWDGRSWVGHGGLVSQGVAEVVSLHGVRMTPDHLVLTTEGWRSASSCEGLDRATCRVPDSFPVRGVGRPEILVGVSLRLRENNADARFGIYEAREEGRNCVLRLPSKRVYITPQNHSRYVQASCIRSVALDDRSLSSPRAPSVEELRRTRNISLPALAGKFRELLVGYGADLPSGATDREGGQQRQLLSGELSLGHAGGSSSQSENEHGDRHPLRANDSCGCFEGFRRRADHDPLAAAKRVAGAIRVYDIANSGPQNRFVVRDQDGRPLIVHNCENATQAHAREILKPAELRVHEAWTPPLRKRGYIRDDESALILDVYDELVAEVPEDFGSVEEFAAMMKGPAEDWYADWPINVDVWTGKVYRK